MSKLAPAAAAAFLMMLAAVPAAAQHAAADPITTANAAAEEQVAASREPAAASDTATACTLKKKRKGFALGGILKAASKSGLTSMVGGSLLGKTGPIANAAINTGASIAESSASKSKLDPSAC
jgi:hypothetical protein